MKKKFLVVGVTGGIATGKSTVSSMFKKFGAAVIDTDKIVHDLLKNDRECIEKVIRLMGDPVVRRGVLNRKRIAAIVFNDPAKLRRLERILHPRVRRAVLEKLDALKKAKKKGAGIVVLEVPLLFEAGFDRLVDVIVTVKTDRKTQMERGMKSSGLTQTELARRIRSQMPLADKILLSDVVIDNSGPKEKTQKQAARLWGRLFKE